MRKLALQVQTTIDGYMAGPNGEMDWVTTPWSDDINSYIDDIMRPVDCIVLGRKLAEGFIPAWHARREQPDGRHANAVARMNDTPKVVISNTLSESPWENAIISGGDLATSINRIKAGPGGDLVVYGGAALVSDLVAENLIDDLHLFVNPTAIGGGIPVFPILHEDRTLRLVEARPFDCGITLLHYRPNSP